jgi:hypothetical protein
MLCFVTSRRFCANAKGTYQGSLHSAEKRKSDRVSLRLRERGWVPYKIYLDDKLKAWSALVIDWKRAA